MKPKYKLGTMVRVEHGDEYITATEGVDCPLYGTINKIIIQADGIEYSVDTMDRAVPEKWIAATYTAKETIRQPKRKPRSAKKLTEEIQNNMVTQ